VSILREKLREKSIIIYEGKGCFKNKVFQVGNIGELSLDDIQFFLKSLGEILRNFDQVDIINVISANDHQALFSYANENSENTSLVSKN
jgi:2-aminoethylphosphonate-pyruvate transaminase